jgi:hypothetical protein
MHNSLALFPSVADSIRTSLLLVPYVIWTFQEFSLLQSVCNKLRVLY